MLSPALPFAVISSIDPIIRGRRRIEIEMIVANGSDCTRRRTQIDQLSYSSPTMEVLSVLIISIIKVVWGAWLSHGVPTISRAWVFGIKSYRGHDCVALQILLMHRGSLVIGTRLFDRGVSCHSLLVRIVVGSEKARSWHVK